MKARSWPLALMVVGAVLISFFAVVRCQGDGSSITMPIKKDYENGEPAALECNNEGGINQSLIRHSTSDLYLTLEGPVEVCIDGQYESLCDIGWDEADARALCHSVRRYSVAEPLYGLGFPQKRYAPRTFNCSKQDHSLHDCSYTSDFDPECNNGSHVAGVRCRLSCTDGRIDLRNRTYETTDRTYKGQVAICINGTFWPICDVGWDNLDAHVVCRHLYGKNFIGEVYPSFPLLPSFNRHLAQDFMCNGTENSLTQCGYNPPSSPECSVGNHSAAVVCKYVCLEGDVRLDSYIANPPYYLVNLGGTFQVCVNGQYGYICADNWDVKEANVVCRNLFGRRFSPYFENTASAVSLVPQDVPIYRYSMCNGTENSFDKCQLPRSDNSTCPSIAAVNCSEVITRCYSNTGNTGSRFRLVKYARNESSDGSSITIAGRVEVCSNFTYKSLCHEYWDPADAHVLCQGYLRHFSPNNTITGRPSLPSQYGYSKAGVVAYSVMCDGSESRIEDCGIDESPNRDFNSSFLCRENAAGVVCTSTPPEPPCTEYYLRVKNQTNQTTQGFYQIIVASVEICIKGTYVAICDLGWDDKDAQLACNALGYSEPFYRGLALSGFVATASIGIENVECPSNSTSVSECSSTTPPQTARCLSKFNAAGIRCSQERSQCNKEGEFSIVNVTYDNYLGQLVGGDIDFGSVMGKVVICQDGVYGSVCDVNWDHNDANVFCNSIGFGEAIPLHQYETGADPIVLEEVNCTGNEPNIASCPTSPLGQMTIPVCNESNRAAGVRCSSKPGTCINDTARLVNGSAFYEGRLEVCRNNQWFAVCEEGLTMPTAVDVCNQKLFLPGDDIEVFYGGAYGSGREPALIARKDVCNPQNLEFVPVGSCSSDTVLSIKCTSESVAGLRCSKGQLNMLIIPRGDEKLDSTSFSLQCFAQQFPWNTTLISGGWYDADGNPIIDTLNGGPVSVDLLQNTYDAGGFGVNLTYTFRNELKFNRSLRFSDAGYYYCNVSVELTYPDDSTAILSNITAYQLKIEGPLPMVTISIKYYIYHNYPLTVTCWVTFEEAVPLEMVEIEWLNADGSEVKPDVISDRIQISQINQINGSRYSRDIKFNPLRYEDSGMYICGARVKGKSIISRSVYQSYHLNIHRPTVHFPKGLCSVVVWTSPDVSCELIRGYELQLSADVYFPPAHTVTRHIGANETFYIIKDEDKMGASGEEKYYVQIRVIYSSGKSRWGLYGNLGCEPRPTPAPEIPRIHFEINGNVYLNNSALPLTDIGEGTSALYCRTDKEECCGVVPNRFGQFYYPSGVQVPIANRQQGFYRNRGDQIIRLNRREGITSPTGTYRCEIPDADDILVNIYITLTG